MAFTPRFTRHLVLTLGWLSTSAVTAMPFINEIHFHPQSSLGSPENTMREWIEIKNSFPEDVDLSGYRLTRGVSLTMPSGTILAGDGFLILAADRAAFLAAHPGSTATIISGWQGVLSNKGETIRLVDAAGRKVDEVSYADDGDWGTRSRSAVSVQDAGWEWSNPADGQGHTLELTQPTLSNENGQNWNASATPGGTPGQNNSTSLTNAAPLIDQPKHRPTVPTSTESVEVSCRILDELVSASATLYWRLDGAPDFTTAVMLDADGDGDLEAQIPPQANARIIEYYIQASDGVNLRTWPAPAITSAPGVVPVTTGQVTNALYQVDSSFSTAKDFSLPESAPVVRMILTKIERDQLVRLQTTSGRQQSDATFNASIVIHDGSGLSVIHNGGVRNRGFGSALGPPNNYHVDFRSSDQWRNRGSIALNCQFPYGQIIGNASFAKANIPPQEAESVQALLNGANLASIGDRMYGRYALLENRGSDWVENHFPDDSAGNLYRLDDHAYSVGDARGGEFRYEGEDPAAYADTFLKENNQNENDFSDLIALAKVVSASPTVGTASQPAISDADYPAAVASVLDVDQFYRYFATDTLIANREGGLQTGRSDDASVYRGVVDPRFKFIPHDLDDVFGIGVTSGNAATRSIFGHATQNGGVSGLNRLFEHPAMIPRYYAALLDGMNTWFNEAALSPVINQTLLGWIPFNDTSSATRSTTKILQFVTNRRANVLSQIPQVWTLTATGDSANSPEGYTVTSTGAVTFNGSFNVARTYSATVNGQLANLFYRATATQDAGTWTYAVPLGGGLILRPGLNNVVTRFWSAPSGTGQIIHEVTTRVLYQTPAATVINGSLSSPGSLALSTPESFIPGLPFLVRVDQRDAQGQLNRNAWNTTVNLTASNGVTLTPTTVTLYNGLGSALVIPSKNANNTLPPYFNYGSGGEGTINSPSGNPGSLWRVKHDLTNVTAPTYPTAWTTLGFDDAAWIQRPSQTGLGDADENQSFPRLDFNPTIANIQTIPVILFRNTFTVADLPSLASVNGQIKFDDGYIIYINGTELQRSNNVPATATLTTFATAAKPDNSTEDFTIPLSLLVQGANTIAVSLHQETTSTDLTFDLRLQGNLLGTILDPGSFVLQATAAPTSTTASTSTSKALSSLGTTAATAVSGTLAGAQTWSGIIHVTADVTVPAGATLTIAPGTHVLMQGTTEAGSETGADLIIDGGSLIADGTASQPISITSHISTGRWGQLRLANTTQITHLQHVHLTRGAHAPGRGHTSTGPVLQLSNADATLTSCSLGDSPGKALYTTGASDVIIRNSLLARLVTGPEIGNGGSLLLEDSNIQECLPIHRESSDPTPDDEDCLYIHNSAGQPMLVQRSVLARCGDDVIDCLSGPITIAHSIIREGWDKGISLLDNSLTLSNTLIIDCDKGVAFKNNTAGATHTASLTRCTIVGEEHDTNLAPWGYTVPPSAGDADIPTTGFWTQWKAGGGAPTRDGPMIANFNSCIISAKQPIKLDNAPGEYTSTPTTAIHTITQDTDTTGATPWPGTGNSAADPLFNSPSTDDYRLRSGSPAIDTGDPLLTDPDGSRADSGALPTGLATDPGLSGEVRWTALNSPYRITASTTIPAAVTLVIEPGVSVQFSENARLTVLGRLLAVGTAAQRITFSHIPGAIVTGRDVDPIKLLVQNGAPKWGGIRITNSMAAENQVRYADFINAQGTDPTNEENYGSIGFIRSRGWVDHCTWSGTHLRMCYGRNSILTVTHCVFPNMFNFDPVLNRIEEPTTDFIAAADNRMEPLKNEYPVTDLPVTSNPAAFPNGLPAGGHFRVYYNQFNGNRGHQDVFDADSGRWNQPGQFLLDCRYNHFRGLAGDEHIDLGGDAYIASNILENATKDFWTNDTGYSNAISSGDKGSGTTIMVARNTCYDLDHVINCKLSTATIFEHNTVANTHFDFEYVGSTVNQSVQCAPVNFFIPRDGGTPTVGDGAYLGYNLISSAPRLFSGADTRDSDPGIGSTLTNDITTKIEFFHNLLSAIGDDSIGPRHPGGIFGGTYGPNAKGDPGFIDPQAENYALAPGSRARGTAPGGVDYGATIPEWAFILHGPRGTVTDTTATFSIGGPGIVRYRWRLNSGPWSDPLIIGQGGVLPRNAPVVRQATLSLTGLTAGPQLLEVLGQDMAGNWQDADPARTIEGLPQAQPTARTWTIDTTRPLLTITGITPSIIGSQGISPISTVSFTSLNSAAFSPSGWLLRTNSGTTPLSPATISLDGTFTLQLAVPLQLQDETVSLIDPTGTVHDTVTYGRLPIYIAISRTDSQSPWKFTSVDTPAAFTLGDQRHILINEWITANGIHYTHDLVELLNTSENLVDLHGLTLTDGFYQTTAPFPPLTILAPGAFHILTNDPTALPGARLHFSLAAFTDEIYLWSPTRTIIDYVRTSPATATGSEGRLNGLITRFPIATPGGSNSADTQFAATILASLRITEIMYAPPGGTDFEFLELTNSGSLTLDLSGIRFTEGVEFTFPAATTLAPGASILVVKNLTAFQSRYGTNLPIAGTFQGILDNSGEDIQLTLPAPSFAHILNIRYGPNWYNTDTSGLSLDLRSPQTPLNLLDEQASWKPSATLLGSPAGWSPFPPIHTLATWLSFHRLTTADWLGDPDQDTNTNLIEYAFNTDPAVPNSPSTYFTPLGTPGYDAITLALPLTSAPGGYGSASVLYEVQTSPDLLIWTTVASKSPTSTTWASGLTITPSLVPPPGSASFLISGLDTSSPRHYTRLKATFIAP